MEGKKKRKNYFSNQGGDFKKRKRLSLECGMRGFLCTCNFREKDCIREAYKLLEEYADIYASNGKESNTTDKEAEFNSNKQNEVEKEEENNTESKDEDLPNKESEDKIKEETESTEKDLKDEKLSREESGDNKGESNVNEQSKDEKNEEENNMKLEDKELPSKESEENKSEEAESIEKDVNDDDEEDEDISTALNKEINELKAEAGKPLSQKKFQVVDTGVSNVVFIKTTVPDPLELVTAVVKDLYETKKQKCRYLLRLLPIQVVCKAYIDDIRAKAEPLLEKYFGQEPKTFAIVFNRHSNNNLHRSDVIEDLAKIISRKNPGNKANLKNPEIAVVVEVIRAVCLISIAPQYFTYKKYNLLEICNKK